MVQGVYVDILLVVNFLVNVLLLSLLETVCARREKSQWRKASAAIVASLFSLSIFLPPLSFIGEMLLKTACSLIMVLIAFSWRGTVAFFKEWFLLLIITLLFYGVMGAMQGWFSGAGLFVFEHAVYFHLRTPIFIICLAGAYAVVWIANRLLASLCQTDQLYCVEISVAGGKGEFVGMVDTGNNLTEPFSGSPVIVCSLDTAAKLLPQKLLFAAMGEENEESCHVRQIPFSTVSGSGMMPAVRGERLLLRPMETDEGSAKEELRVEEFFLAISKEAIGSGEWQILLSQKLLQKAAAVPTTLAAGKDGVSR